MDIRRADQPTIEHGGTVSTFFMFDKESVREATMGSYLEYVAEFELDAGVTVESHHHETDEFYYVLSGSGTMYIEAEVRAISPGDLVHIPRSAVHTVAAAAEQSLRCLSFAVSYMAPGTSFTPAPLPSPTA